MLNNRKLYQDVADGLEPILSCINMPEGHNIKFDLGDLNSTMMAAMLMDASIGGCANAVKTKYGSRTPSDRWCADKLKKTDTEKLQKEFALSVRRHIKTLRKKGKIPKKGVTIAIDLHKIERYDKDQTDDLTHSKYSNGTAYFERYMTVSCVDKKVKINLVAAYLKNGDSVPKFLKILLKLTRNTGIKIRLVLLDREFFSVESIGILLCSRLRFLVPCINRKSVVDALGEFVQKERGTVSKHTLKGKSGSVTYTMIITKRKKVKKPVKPEEKYIGFATNDPTIKPERYDSRWGIETGYRLVEDMRAKTRIKNVAARMLCFFYSLLGYNEWMIMRMLHSDNSERQSGLTQLVFKFGLVSISILEPKPPP